MKNNFIIFVVIILMIFGSCERQDSELKELPIGENLYIIHSNYNTDHTNKLPIHIKVPENAKLISITCSFYNDEVKDQHLYRQSVYKKISKRGVLDDILKIPNILELSSKVAQLIDAPPGDADGTIYFIPDSASLLKFLDSGCSDPDSLYFKYSILKYSLINVTQGTINIEVDSTLEDFYLGVINCNKFEKISMKVAGVVFPKPKKIKENGSEERKVYQRRNRNN